MFEFPSRENALVSVEFCRFVVGRLEPDFRKNTFCTWIPCKMEDF